VTCPVFDVDIGGGFFGAEKHVSTGIVVLFGNDPCFLVCWR